VTYTTSGIFNFAHGALGMIAAFAYWHVSVEWGWPVPIALLLVLGVFSPLMGAVIERTLMRKLHGASTGTGLVVSLGLLLALVGLAQIVWDPNTARVVPEFFAGSQVELFGVGIRYHQLITLAVTIAVAIALKVFFSQTRTGIAMRAVVDDPDLMSMTGASPARVAMLSWAMGSALAGLAGILLAPTVSLDVLILTLLVVSGYAAAMVGRLKSLPLTFLGGLALGLAESYSIWQLPTDLLNKIRPALPIIFLYVVLLIMPQARLRAGRLVTSRRPPRVASFRESLIGAVAFLAISGVLASALSTPDLITIGQGVVFGLIMLSIVLLTGWAGQVSLAQMTFVGLGAFAMGKTFGGDSAWGILAAALLAGAVGAVAALPALRLQGLYLALSTLAFARGMDTLFFNNEDTFGYGGSLPVGRPEILGVSFEGPRAYFMLICVVFAVAGVGVLALRRGKFGRRLVAMKDSPAACATLGINLTFTKLAVFALSAALAGVAGVFYGGMRGRVTPANFEMLNSLVLLLLVTISGINTVSGALMGGVVFGLFPKLQQQFKSLRNLTYVLTGLGALGVARNPNGWTSELEPLGNLWRRLTRQRDGEPPPPPTSAVEGPAEREVDLVGASR
jgi:branched-chain amino acid transport system permease protein